MYTIDVTVYIRNARTIITIFPVFLFSPLSLPSQPSQSIIITIYLFLYLYLLYQLTVHYRIWYTMRERGNKKDKKKNWFKIIV